MTKDDVKMFVKTLEEKGEGLRAVLLLTLPHDGSIGIQMHGPVGQLGDFIVLEKVLSNYLTDLMQGRLQDPRVPNKPDQKEPHLNLIN